jgi:hypothetical protein
MTIDDEWGEKTCLELLAAFLETKTPEFCPLPDRTKVIMNCIKMCDTSHGRPASDVGLNQDCSVFLNFPVRLTMEEVPTKRFSFTCTRHVPDVPTRATNAMVTMMAMVSSGPIHLPSKRSCRKMTSKDILYDDFIDYMKKEGVGFPADEVTSLGSDFLRHITHAIFPLSAKAWEHLNDSHNRGGVAPEEEFSAFFGRKVLGHKLDGHNPKP